MSYVSWARYGDGYEVSSTGDRRFSALFAMLADGRTIEEAYQLDVKGYREIGNHWKLGKGRPALRKGIDLWAEYLALWRRWAAENPRLLTELNNAVERANFLLTDRFASGPVSQARALAELLNEMNYEDLI